MRSALPFTLLAVVTIACAADVPTIAAPNVGTLTRNGQTSDQTTASERWNAVTRTIVARREFGPLGIARTFALVSVAQYDAVIAAQRSSPKRKDPSEAAAAAAASAAVLSTLYPAEEAFITAQLDVDVASYGPSKANKHSDVAAGMAIGHEVAVAVLARAATDRSDAVWTGTLPTGPGLWFSAPLPARPLSPLWGQVRPWLMTSGDQLRPSAPPAFGSPAFQSALAEVRRYSDARTPEQLAIAQFWGAVVNTAGPPGYWSEVGLALAARHNAGERRTSRMLAMMHTAGMDASIACWDAKYAYQLIRPYQVDAAITTPVGRPNFPAYPSAHSCLSAAYAGVLIGLFPGAANELKAQVEEAGVSRIYAGLHYRFDVDAGQDIGFAAARLALKKVGGNRAIALD